MTGFRQVGLWAAGLAWLAVGVGCVNDDAKMSEMAKTEVAENQNEAVTADKSVAVEPGSTVIPLKKIWATQIPGTLNIHLLEQDYFESTARKPSEQEGSLCHQMFMTILDQFDENQPTAPGFAVAGTGYVALAAAKEIVVEQDKIPSQTFSAGTEVTLFFFTGISRLGLQLKDVRQSKGTVTLRYHYPWFNPQGPIDAMSKVYFALIPLGKPSAGNIVVNIVESPTKNKHDWLTYQSPEEYVCKSFAFTIEPTNSGTEINE